MAGRSAFDRDRHQRLAAHILQIDRPDGAERVEDEFRGPRNLAIGAAERRTVACTDEFEVAARTQVDLALDQPRPRRIPPASDMLGLRPRFEHLFSGRRKCAPQRDRQRGAIDGEPVWAGACGSISMSLLRLPRFPQMLVQIVEPGLPLPPERLDPFGNVLERAGDQFAWPTLGVAPPLYEPGALENLEMF